ncbi:MULTISPECIES: AraC family transcriptional regulator [Legionellaceae]|uniref:AraC family transcriptional regulator n=1 Tax=Legionella maceachernii TaxID=466 RepID=A0A0W0VZ32_9GAMM|nr:MULTISPECIES: AraC family transcriptional regulator [Legionellaceae]HAT9213002.1 helix-turn-helix domain-containing protein [Legionella pneumophila subsp. pneumophila]KTD25267.1 AraC family transcriptional regulator [Legionella maceachernii]MCK1848539.1 AraC family transcriptional regulator [Legionella pneumophila]MCW8462367.1 AraC family transcriptional regulator [Fluoribacter dumoffii]MCW8493254.1 AraC family transcriptional regulator [Legionella pneumophila]
MNYKQQLDKVIEFIGKHLDEKLDLTQLSQIACFSKYHFHRLFTAYTGLSLQHYIRWLRLKRAAHQLIVDRNKTIIEIAISAGFESHEAFTRVFKQSCGLSPSEFRLHSNWSFWEHPPYLLPNQGNIMNVLIKEIPARRLAVIEHRGTPEKLGESVNQLIDWAKSQSINLKPKAGEAFGFAYDDPKTTEPSDFRFDLAITVPEQIKLEGNIVERRLPAGRYAVATHKGTRDTISDTVYSLYRDWLPSSDEQLGDLPCIFCYYNFDHEVAETELLTECWLLLA